jgi:hypothetical protein
MRNMVNPRELSEKRARAGRKGGKARATSLTKKQRRESALNAARVGAVMRRFGKKAATAVRTALSKKATDRTESDRIAVRIYRLMLRAQEMSDRGIW